MISIEALEIMVANGSTAEAIVAVIKADREADARTLAEKREAVAERKRKSRMSHDVTTVTRCHTMSQTAESAPPCSNTPPIKEECSEPKKVLRIQRAKVETSLPEGWKPSDEDRAYARSKGWDETRIDRQAERFINHALAKDRRLKDWAAGWRNWVTSQFQEPGNERSGPRTATVSPITATLNGRIADLEREIADLETTGDGGDESRPSPPRLLSHWRG